MITLDGSQGEGGGALVRVALALSTFTGKEFKVTNIRAGREQGGLKAQHLAAIKALKKMCDAETNEVQIGSTDLWFKPGEIKGGRYEFDIGTAGSITLFLQAIILPCLFAPKKVTLTVKGGTSGKWQASVDYLQYVLLPQLKRFVEKIEVKILKRGYYPEGGGEIILEIIPKYTKEEIEEKISIMRLVEQGTLEQIKGIVNLSSELEEQRVGERIRQTVEMGLRDYHVPTTIRVEYARSSSIGGEVVIWALFSSAKDEERKNPVILGGDALLEKGKRSEDVAKEAIAELREEIDNGAVVDQHLADQLIPFMGLLPGSMIKVREITPHTQTNIDIVEKFLPVRFSVEEKLIKVEAYQK
ncbi:RNA 3'-terminal phosphate cyclase [Candidatus Woesearchaeota archaeon]|nr:RNA 3'-terminal phosphate cyclase [Candidatus Woesearchaeota archaeon]